MPHLWWNPSSGFPVKVLAITSKVLHTLLPLCPHLLVSSLWISFQPRWPLIFFQLWTFAFMIPLPGVSSPRYRHRSLSFPSCSAQTCPSQKGLPWPLYKALYPLYALPVDAPYYLLHITYRYLAYVVHWFGWLSSLLLECTVCLFCSLPHLQGLELSLGPTASSVGDWIIRPVGHIYLLRGLCPKASEITPDREDIFLKFLT